MRDKLTEKIIHRVAIHERGEMKKELWFLGVLTFSLVIGFCFILGALINEMLVIGIDQIVILAWEDFGLLREYWNELSFLLYELIPWSLFGWFFVSGLLVGVVVKILTSDIRRVIKKTKEIREVEERG